MRSRDATQRGLRTVVCGSYKRDVELLRSEVLELKTAGVDILSPGDLEFVRIENGFAYAERDLGRPPAEIEEQHLRALLGADFVWLHAPEGYVGLSAALELGFAHAARIPVLSATQVKDVTLSEFVHTVGSPTEAVAHVQGVERNVPSSGISALQTYYADVATRRGYEQESARDCLLLLTEEVGELARAIRKSSGLARHQGFSNSDPALELADVQLYLVHLANILGVNLGEAILHKEQINADRSRAARDQLSA